MWALAREDGRGEVAGSIPRGRARLGGFWLILISLQRPKRRRFGAPGGTHARCHVRQPCAQAAPRGAAVSLSQPLIPSLLLTRGSILKPLNAKFHNSFSPFRL